MPDRTTRSDTDRILDCIERIHTVSLSLTRETARRLGLTGPRLVILRILEENGDLSLSEISKRVRRRNSTVTGMVNRMVAAGLVTRERSIGDRRVVRVRTTKLGARLARGGSPSSSGNLRGVLSSLARTDRETLLRILQVLADSTQRGASLEEEME